MELKQLPARPSLEQYKKQAKELVKGRQSGEAETLRRIRQHHPQFRKLPEADALNAKFALADAQWVIAREHGFESWPKFAQHVAAVKQKHSPVSQFEAAADAVVSGDLATLERLLRADANLIRAHSTREHRATLLHYVAANGVEDFRQKTPPNAVAVAELLLQAGAEVDAPNDDYGAGTALGLVATSVHPWLAGVQIALLETLLQHGAAVDGQPGGWNPLIAALHNDRPEAAAFLAERGARLDLEAAAGVGRLDVVKTFFHDDSTLKPNATPAQMQSGFIWACEYGHQTVVEFLLDKGVDLRAGENTDQTALHLAAHRGQLAIIKLLLERGAPLEARNGYGGTVLGQATWSVMYGDPNINFVPIIETLLAAGAKIEEADFPTGNARVDEVLGRHGAQPTAPDAPVQEAQPPQPLRHSLEQYEKLAADVVEAYNTGAGATLRRIADFARFPVTQERLRAEIQRGLGKAPEGDLALDDAQFFIARVHGFENWPALSEHFAALPAGGNSAAKPVKLFHRDQSGREQTTRVWDEVFELLRQQKITGLNAEGQMTDELLACLAQCEHLTSLQLEGSQQVTDAGLRQLARLPHLQHLNLTGCRLTDEGLAVLRDLPELRSFQLFHQHGISDAGLAHLAHCHQLERVELLGTPTGDGVLKALAGKARLRHLKTGNEVTNAGLALLHEFPVFKSWRGGEVSMSLLGFEAEPSYLLARGSFTDDGLTSLVGLDGLFALNLDASELALTAACFKSLAQLPKLGWLGFDATDETLPHIAALPHLRFLMCQDTVAGDDGFTALSRSQTIEYIWGRRCHNLTGRGFAALARMPALRALSVSCQNVDDAALSALPSFPALRELMPMDVSDEGYRHIGRCEQLESLVLMYCRETGDAATAHIAGLPRLKKYFASYTKITDRSLQILSRMPSLEQITFYGCPAVTNAGVVALAGLPRLRELSISGPQITPECAAAFAASVRVEISV